MHYAATSTLAAESNIYESHFTSWVCCRHALHPRLSAAGVALFPDEIRSRHLPHHAGEPEYRAAVMGCLRIPDSFVAAHPAECRDVLSCLSSAGDEVALQ